MSLAVFEPGIPAIATPQISASDRTATVIGCENYPEHYLQKNGFQYLDLGRD
jgi:hypothetical protein